MASPFQSSRLRSRSLASDLRSCNSRPRASSRRRSMSMGGAVQFLALLAAVTYSPRTLGAERCDAAVGDGRRVGERVKEMLQSSRTPWMSGDRARTTNAAASDGLAARERQDGYGCGARKSMKGELRLLQRPLHSNNVHRNLAREMQRSARRSSHLHLQQRAASEVGPTLTTPVARFDYGPVYVMGLEYGTPPQTLVNLIVDTGSDLMYLQCLPCSSCLPQADPIFDPHHSSSYTKVGCEDPVCTGFQGSTCANSACQYHYRYGSGYTNGEIALESVTLAGVELKGLIIGCGFDNGGNLGNADGIVGMGRSAVSLIGQVGPVYGMKFSYCLSDYRLVPPRPSPLQIGDPFIPQGIDVRYTYFSNRPGFQNNHYYLDLNYISVNLEFLDLDRKIFDRDAQGGGGFVIDSGTTLTVLVDTAYYNLIVRLRSVVTYPEVRVDGQDCCWDVSGVEKVDLPLVIFHFNNANTEAPSADFGLGQEATYSYVEPSTVCLAMAHVADGGLNILGLWSQQNQFILYDLENNTLGFSYFKCDTLQIP